MIPVHIREGYPSYLSDETIERIEKEIEGHAWQLRDILRDLFGSVALKGVPPQKMEHWLRSLAQRSAHEAAGQLVDEGARSATQASINMLNGVLAGIEIGQEKAG